MMKPLRCRVWVAAGACVGLGCSLCCSMADRRYEPARSDCAPASCHAVHSEQLRAIMSGLGVRADKVWPQEIAQERAADAAREREARFDEARELATALGRAAGQIPQAIAGVELAGTERDAFFVAVDRLKFHAGELEVAAGRRDFDRMESILGSIRTTCNECHAQFRELAGPIQAPGSDLWVEAG